MYGMVLKEPRMVFRQFWNLGSICNFLKLLVSGSGHIYIYIWLVPETVLLFYVLLGLFAMVVSIHIHSRIDFRYFYLSMQHGFD